MGNVKIVGKFVNNGGPSLHTIKNACYDNFIRKLIQIKRREDDGKL